MKWFIYCLLALFSILSFAGGQQKTTVISDYSNITTSMSHDPHQSGYAVTIYKREDGFLFGDFTFAPGSTEGVGAKLFDLHFEHGHLVFKAKTSAYEMVSLKRSGPSRELFDFSGEVRGNNLIGTLKVWDGYDLSKPQSVQQVKLKRGNTASPLSYEVHQSIFQKDPW